MPELNMDGVFGAMNSLRGLVPVTQASPNDLLSSLWGSTRDDKEKTSMDENDAVEVRRIEDGHSRSMVDKLGARLRGEVPVSLPENTPRTPIREGSENLRWHIKEARNKHIAAMISMVDAQVCKEASICITSLTFADPEDQEFFEILRDFYLEKDDIKVSQAEIDISNDLWSMSRYFVVPKGHGLVDSPSKGFDTDCSNKKVYEKFKVIVVDWSTSC